MKNSIAIGLLFILLALNCFAEPLQLSGNSGRSILVTFENSSIDHTNSTNETDLWNWGKLPVGHSINASSGNLETNPVSEDGLVVVPQRSGP
jgi:hypothetical protein